MATTKDTPELRDLLTKLFPGLVITAAATTSGQRVVYFCRFQAPAPTNQIAWGEVVVKVAEQLNTKQIAYLQKEIDILNSLKSPFYPTLHHNDVFAEHPETEDPLPSRLFVSIEERIPANPLGDCRAQFSNERAVCSLLIQLVDGLDLLWSRPDKLIHRDLKPANILIRASGDVAIIDLGIVREEGSVGNTETGMPFGPCSPPYASPEQARNAKKVISFKSDFFALGTIAYELLTGANPFFDPTTDNRDDVLGKVISLHPPTLHSLGKATKPFSSVIETIMKKQPYERYRTPGRLKDALLMARGTLNVN